MLRLVHPLTAPLAFLALVTTGCASRLPSTRPNDFSVERTTGGGMRPVSSGFRCAGSECVSVARVSQASGEVHYAVTPSQLDAIYRVLREHDVDRIAVREEEEVFDRGGTTIRVDAAGANYAVSNSGNTFVTDVEDWDAIVTAIDALEARLADSAAVDVAILLSDALATSEPTIRFDGEDEGGRTTTTSPANEAERHARLAPGTHVLVVTTRTSRGVATIEVGERRSFRVELRGDALVVE